VCKPIEYKNGMTITLGEILLICSLSALLGIRHVARREPAMVFVGERACLAADQSLPTARVHAGHRTHAGADEAMSILADETGTMFSDNVGSFLTD
jgi:hypothetical protein